MSMGKRKFVALLLLATYILGCDTSVWAAAGTEGASFLNIPVGAGPAALGNAYTALATDAYAPIYNPAGLGFANGMQIAGQHVAYLGSSHYEYFSFIKPLPNGNGLGASIQYLGTGKIDQTDRLGNTIGDFSASFASYNLSYGYAFNNRLSAGGTFKWIRGKLSDVSANTMAGDLGLLYRPLSQWTIATTVTNVGRKLKFINESDRLPLAWHTGTSYDFHPNVLLTGEVVYRKDGPSSSHIGLEWQLLPMAAWRVGYRTDTVSTLSQLAGFTTGVGIQLWGHEFGYAWVPLAELGSTQYFSLVMRFGEQEKERRNLIRFRRVRRHKEAPTWREPYRSDPEQLMQLLNEDASSQPKNAAVPGTPSSQPDYSQELPLQ